MMSLLLVWVAAQDDAQTLRDALKTSVELGGVEFKGSVAPDNEEGPMMFSFGGNDGFEGDFSAKVDAAGTVHVTAEKKDHGTIEIFARGGRWVKRATWTGPAIPADDFAREAASLLDLDHLRDQANRFKNVKAGADEEDCRTFTAELPEGILLDDKASSDEGAGVVITHLDFWKLESIEAKFWVSKEDGRIVKVRTSLTHGVSDQIMVGVDEGGGGPDFKEMKNTRVYTIRAEKYDKEMKVELPEAVKKLLVE